MTVWEYRLVFGRNAYGPYQLCMSRKKKRGILGSMMDTIEDTYYGDELAILNGCIDYMCDPDPDIRKIGLKIWMEHHNSLPVSTIDQNGYVIGKGWGCKILGGVEPMPFFWTKRDIQVIPEGVHTYNA